ncbi:MAG TPA: TetR/AcrR family transcriptional regulator [Caulobacteraceae bacterium]
MSSETKSVQRSGRPRDAKARERILAAASALLDEGGIAAVTMEAIAKRASVGKPTIYREWPNASAVAMAAFLEATKGLAPADRQGGVLAALRRHLRAVAETFSTRAGRNTALMIAAAQSDSELAKVFRIHFIMKSREEGRALIELAVAGGQVRSDLDIEATLDLLYAPLYFRLLIGHAPFDARFVDTIIDAALNGLRPRLALPD